MIENATDLQILKNVLNLLPKTYRKRNVNWVIVQEILLQGTRHGGSGSSYSKCLEIGIDPHGYNLDLKSKGD